MKPKPREIAYSEKYAGDKENYYWSVRFDIMDGCLGITQIEENKLKERVLLSRAQTKQLVRWLRSYGIK